MHWTDTHMKKNGFGARDAIVFSAFAIVVCLIALLLSHLGDLVVRKDAGITITEVMADNKAAYASGGAYRDWVEIKNVSDEAIDLSGWKIACGVDTRGAYDLGVSSLAPGARAVIYCAKDAPVAFNIPRSGAFLSLVNPAGQTAVSLRTPAMDAGECWALDEASGKWALTYEYTPGLPNTHESYAALLYPDQLNSAVVINELMAKNRSTIADGAGKYSDYIELYNSSDAAVDLSDWHLTDDATNRTRQALTGVTVPAGGCTLVYLMGAKGSGFALSTLR